MCEYILRLGCVHVFPVFQVFINGLVDERLIVMRPINGAYRAPVGRILKEVHYQFATAGTYPITDSRGVTDANQPDGDVITRIHHVSRIDASVSC